MKKLTAPGIQTSIFSVRETGPLGLWRRLTPRLLVALATSSFLVACGPDVVDIRTEGTSDSGSTSTGGDAGVVSPVMVSAGNRFACAVTSTGAVKCWGRNQAGELGNDSTTDSPVPVDVVGLSSGIVAVSAGGVHACAVTSTGAVKCWGQNFTGPLGNDSTTDSPVPVDVVGLSSGVLSISAGLLHTCAVTKAGAVKCWGSNGEGQLGNNSTTDSPVPVDVVGLSSGVLAVSAGWNHTCAITATGALQCWGSNTSGELGNTPEPPFPTPLDSLVPVGVVGLSAGVLSVSAGAVHTCAVTAAGAVKCWGWNGHGQLGNNPEISSIPGDVVGLSSGVVAVSAGYGHTCARTSIGAIKCWGQNLAGELGNDSTEEKSPVVVDVVGLSSGVLAVSANFHDTCAVTALGAVECWGDNEHGQLGNDSTADNRVPVEVGGL